MGFRADLAKVEPDELGDRLTVYVYEVNLLLRLASAWGLGTHIDTVERDGYTEIIVRISEPD